MRFFLSVNEAVIATAESMERIWIHSRLNASPDTFSNQFYDISIVNIRITACPFKKLFSDHKKQQQQQKTIPVFSIIPVKIIWH